jgi:molybdate transport system regulatory protein
MELSEAFRGSAATGDGSVTRVVVRIDFANQSHLGHGRIELLELIDQHGSIAKAAKAMQMSYKRAWYLAESINETYAQPVIVRRHGGHGGGSAELTPLGRDIVRAYREMETAIARACAKQLRVLERQLAPPVTKA